MAVVLGGCIPRSSHYYKPSASIGKTVPLMVNYQTGPHEGIFIARPWGEVYVSLERDASNLEVALYSQEGEPSLTGPTLEIEIGNGKRMLLPVTMPEVLTDYFRGRHWGRGWTCLRYQIHREYEEMLSYHLILRSLIARTDQLSEVPMVALRHGRET